VIFAKEKEIFNKIYAYDCEEEDWWRGYFFRMVLYVAKLPCIFSHYFCFFFSYFLFDLLIIGLKSSSICILENM
jgi:hypothetical protein